MENEENAKNDLGKKGAREQKVTKAPEEKVVADDQVTDVLKYLDFAFNDCFSKLKNNELEAQYKLQKVQIDYQEEVRKSSDPADKDGKSKLLDVEKGFQSTQADLSKEAESEREEIQNAYVAALSDVWKRVQAEDADLRRLVEVSQYFNEYATRGIHILQIK
ncbi:hypothetical protein [Fluviicola sp.]|uniref:hypothetical protein n=1 Tax=Fluviicola sp. TaxID=1917219 RepID=UPI0026086EF9|nr:hypothetical protein [Fluviicola sp.]